MVQQAERKFSQSNNKKPQMAENAKETRFTDAKDVLEKFNTEYPDQTNCDSFYN